MEIEIAIGGDEGIKIRLNDDLVQVQKTGFGVLTKEEARAAAMMLNVLANILEDEENGY